MAVEIEQVEGGIAILTLSAETAANGFSLEGMAAIATAVDAALDDDGIRALVLTGTGKMFCAGADIEGFKTSIEEDTIVEFIRDLTGILHPLLLRMRRSGTICIAAMNGAAAGGGLGLALACDARIAGEDALLVSGFANLGLSPDGGTTWLLPRLVGENIARRFILDNSRWTATQALAVGAVDEVVGQQELIGRATEVARAWGKWSRHTREASKHLLDVQSSNDFETQLRHEQLLIMAAGASQDFAEGVEAFLGKREPEFD